MAQTSNSSGTLEGTVSDTSGGVIPGIKVVVREIDTNQTRTVDTDDQGFFRAADLLVGAYEVRIDDSRFAPYVHTGVDLGVGVTVHLQVVLPAAGVSTQVTVSAQPPAIDPTQTSVASTIDRERIEDLPARTRDALSYALLMPGVASSSQRSGTGSHPALADSGFSIGGLRPRSNNISVDGVDNNDEYTGSSRTELSPEDIQEYQVVNNGLSAEYGGASGGSINVVTRTGANVIHGDAYIYIQNEVFDARDHFQTTPGSPNFRRYRVGSSMGGPIIKNRTFFHVAFEQESNVGQDGSDIAPSVSSAVNTFLATNVFPGLKTRQITTGFSPIARAETETSGKLIHQINSKNALMVRYAYNNNREAGNDFNTNALQDAGARGSSFTRDNAFVASLATEFGNGGIGDLRFQAATRNAVLRTNDATGPGIDIVGLVDFGQPYAGNSSRTENHYQVTYSYLRTIGRHQWKAGGTVNDVSSHATVMDGFGGLYLFGSMANFQAGHPDFFIQGFGNPTTDYSVTNYGAFVQDHFSLLPHLTVDMGVRYDFEKLPSGFHEAAANFSPRIGMAFSPRPRLALRAGFGIFYDRQILANLNRAVVDNGVNGFEQVANEAAATALFQGAGGGALVAPAAGIAPSIYRADPRLGTPYSEQANASAEYLLAHDLTASLTYLHVHGVKLPRTVNTNLRPPVVLTPANAASLGVPAPTSQQIGQEVFGPGRVNPAFNDIYLLENSSNSTYNGLTASLKRRMAKGLELIASYTLSKTYDDASDFDEQPQNPFNLHAERALSSQQQQQRFSFNALWNLPIPGQIELVPIITLGTGRPIDPLVGLDSNLSNAFPLSVRPLGFGRNSLTTPAMANVDFGVVKTLRFGEYRHLDLIVQFFNLFNHVTATAINPFWGSGALPLAGFGQPIFGTPPRSIQFAANFEY